MAESASSSGSELAVQGELVLQADEAAIDRVVSDIRRQMEAAQTPGAAPGAAPGAPGPARSFAQAMSFRAETQKREATIAANKAVSERQFRRRRASFTARRGGAVERLVRGGIDRERFTRLLGRKKGRALLMGVAGQRLESAAGRVIGAAGGRVAGSVAGAGARVAMGGAAALGGPVGIAVVAGVAAAAVVAAAPFILARIGRGRMDSMITRAGGYSPHLAAVELYTEMRDRVRERDRGRVLAPSARLLAEANADLSGQLARLTAPVENILNRYLAATEKNAAWAIKVWADLLGLSNIESAKGSINQQFEQFLSPFLSPENAPIRHSHRQDPYVRPPYRSPMPTSFPGIGRPERRINPRPFDIPPGYSAGMVRGIR